MHENRNPGVRYAHEYVKGVNGKRIQGTEITRMLDRELNGIKVERGWIFD